MNETIGQLCLRLLGSKTFLGTTIIVSIADLLKLGTVIGGFVAMCFGIAAGYYQFDTWKTKREIEKINLKHLTDQDK
jgi:hypothetical protein